MNRPKYKELYLEEKRKTKFSYNLLMSIVDMLNKLEIEAEIEKKFDKYILEKLAILKLHNPNNNLYACIKIKEDLLEGAKYEWINR